MGVVERLRRLEWLFERAPIYFITTCTHERRKILAGPHVHERLIQFAKGGPGHGVWLGEELTIDYRLSPDSSPEPCRCRASKCRGLMNAS